MSALHATWSWLTTAGHWSGSGGVGVRVVQHLQISGEAMLLAAVVALPVGVVLGHLGRGGVLAVNIANAGRAVPTLGVLVLLVLALGLGNAPVIYALALFGAPPMLVNAYLGMRGVDPEVKDAAKGSGLSRWQLLRRVELPLAVPLIAAGVRTAAVQVVATATIAAIVGSGGLGRFVVDGFVTQDQGQYIGGALLVAVLAVAVEVALGRLERWVTPGARATGSAASIDPSLTVAGNATAGG